MNQQNKQQEKIVMEAQETKMGALIRNSKTIFIYLMAACVAVIFLSHILFENDVPDTLKPTYEKRKEISYSIESISDSIVSIASIASKQDLIMLQSQLSKLNIEYEKINDIYSVKREETRISGFPNIHKFLWHFGIGLVITSLSIFMLLTVNMFEDERKKAVNFASMLGVTASGYYMAWIFFPENDLPYNTYIGLLLGMGILSAFMSYWINRVTFLTRAKLKSFIRFIMRFVIVDSKDHVKDIDKWNKDVVGPILKKLDE